MSMFQRRPLQTALMSLVFLFVLAALSANAEILVADDFEKHPVADFPLVGPKKVSNCFSDSQQLGLCDVPEPWTWYRSTGCKHGNCSSGIHDVSGSKAWTYWMESRPTTTWGNDGMLSWWSGGQTYPEMWVQFDARFDPEWEMLKSTMFKIFRIFDYVGCCGESAFGKCSADSCERAPNLKPSWGDCPPYQFTGVKCNRGGFFLDPVGLETLRVAARCVNAFNCCGKPRWGRSPGCGSSNGQNYRAGRFDRPGNWGDGDWHRWRFQVVMNTDGKANGIIRFWLDDNLIFEEKDVPFQDQGPRVMTGFDSFHLGGNVSRHEVTAERWYAFDNVCAATSEEDLAGCPQRNSTSPAESAAGPSSGDEHKTKPTSAAPASSLSPS